MSSTIDGREDHLESFLALFECLLASAVGVLPRKGVGESAIRREGEIEQQLALRVGHRG